MLCFQRLFEQQKGCSRQGPLPPITFPPSDGWMPHECRLFEQQKELSWAAAGRPAAGMPPAVQDARPWTATTITSYGSKVEEVREAMGAVGMEG